MDKVIKFQTVGGTISIPATRLLLWRIHDNLGGTLDPVWTLEVKTEVGRFDNKYSNAIDAYFDYNELNKFVSLNHSSCLERYDEPILDLAGGKWEYRGGQL